MNVYIVLLIVVLVAFVVVVMFRAMNRPDPRHPHNWPASPQDGPDAGNGGDSPT